MMSSLKNNLKLACCVFGVFSNKSFYNDAMVTIPVNLNINALVKIIRCSRLIFKKLDAIKTKSCV